MDLELPKGANPKPKAKSNTENTRIIPRNIKL